MAKYKPAAFQKAKAGGGFAGGFTLPEGLRTATARLDGAGGAPGFTLTGPNGLRISYPGPAAGTVTGKGFAVVTVRGQTFVRLAHPSGGPYRVVGAGGTSITELTVAHGLPDPKVHGKVIRLHGRKRLLRYRGSGLSGQKVMFVEQGKGVRDVIATTRKHRGKIRFQPASGPRGRAAIVAIVTRHGIPRVQMTVAHFKAPGPLLPGRPRHVRLRRRGTKLVVRWKAAPRARRYAVAWALRDGRRQAKIVRGHRLRIRGVPGIDAGRIKVAGLRRDNVAGPAARAKLKRHPKHRHHHRHHHHRRSRA